MRTQHPSFLFDLDGTLIDSVYQHVLAWREAVESENIELSVGRIQLDRTGAYRVYEDPADLLNHLDEVARRR